MARKNVVENQPDLDEAPEIKLSLMLATGAVKRARGLLLGKSGDDALLLAPCNDVHTVGMRRAIDVAFVDGTGLVIEAHRSVGPLRRLRNKGAVAVIERFASCETPWFSEGERVALSAKKGAGR